MPGPCAPASAATRMPTWPPWNSKRASQLCRPRKKSGPSFGSAAMPGTERIVLCGDVLSPHAAGSGVLRLSLHGAKPNVNLRIQDISKRVVSNIPHELVDLLEVATYVYAADSAVSRGGQTDAQLGARWRRRFRFVIPVRRPDLWNS